jgi:hypothetical protein
MDLLGDDLRVVVAPGQNAGAAIAYRVNRGFIDTGFETSIFGDSSQTTQGGVLTTAVGAETVFSLALQQGIQPLVLLPQDASRLDALGFPANVKTLITTTLARGEMVIVPSQAVVINGQSRLAWYEVNTVTGATIGVLDDGSHGFGETSLTMF